MTDLYQVLGLTAQCDATDIRRRYKLLAQTHHPDKGGDPEQFHKIQQAYDVLRDPGRRAAYDKDGTVDRKPSLEQKVTKSLMELFSEMLAAGTHEDIILCARKRVESEMYKVAQKKTGISQQISALEARCGRVTSRGDENLFEQLVRNQISLLEKSKQECQGAIEVMEAMNLALRDYEDTGYTPLHDPTGGSYW